MSDEKIAALEQQIYKLSLELVELRKQVAGTEVPDYPFNDLDGTVSLSELFMGRERLLAIHNMGQGCRYCTLWGDGVNGFLPHLESALAVVMLSKDDPETQRRFANSRGWRFRMASHGGGDYIRDQGTEPGQGNMPGVVCYEQRDGKIYRLGGSSFGPGDLYCSIWHFLGLAKLGTEDWTPQYNYWRRPQTLDDGGRNLVD